MRQEYAASTHTSSLPVAGGAVGVASVGIKKKYCSSLFGCQILREVCATFILSNKNAWSEMSPSNGKETGSRHPQTEKVR